MPAPVEPPAPQRFATEIRAFEEQDEAKPPEKGGVVFVGSSSIRMWDLAKSFPGINAVNRGFGGSHVADSTYYADRIVVKHAPSIIVFYAGDNDIDFGLDPCLVVDNYREFVRKVRHRLPEVRIVFLSIKPSIARWKHYPRMAEANCSICRFIADDPRSTFVDLAPLMLGLNGQPRADLFLEDGLHLNSKGYDIWTRAVAPFLPAPRNSSSASAETHLDPAANRFEH